MTDNHFPFVIYGVAEEDIVKLFFSFMAHFDTRTLLRCRLVSKRWRDAIDSLTMLWVRIKGFQRACSEGIISIVNRLLELPEGRIDVNAGFHIACCRGQLNIVNRLLELPEGRLEIDTRDYKGHTPLFSACSFGRLDVVNRLLELPEEKLDLNVKSPLLGQTLFHEACCNGNLAILNRLLELPEERLDINIRNNHGSTGFDSACWANLAVVKRLLEVAYTRNIDVEKGLRSAKTHGRDDIVDAIKQYILVGPRIWLAIRSKEL